MPGIRFYICSFHSNNILLIRSCGWQYFPKMVKTGSPIPHAFPSAWLWQSPIERWGLQELHLHFGGLMTPAERCYVISEAKSQQTIQFLLDVLGAFISKTCPSLSRERSTWRGPNSSHHLTSDVSEPSWKLSLLDAMQTEASCLLQVLPKLQTHDTWFIIIVLSHKEFGKCVTKQ